MNPSFQIIPIKSLKESSFNPRKTYDPKKLEELTQSIKEKGILTPLILRPQNGAYEIAAGSRRYRAAIAAGLTEVPAIIRELTDTEFIEIITIENLQREDLHPLEEAEGYRSLMETGHYDVAALSIKVGKSPSYIYQRLKLSDLIPEAKKAFLDEKITAGHAILIARLQPKDQKKALEECTNYGDCSVRALADHIESQIHLDLNSASFSKKDPELLPEAGPCTTCPKRTGFLPDLFPDIKKKDTCTDRECFHKKIRSFIDRWLEERSKNTDIPPLKLSGDYDYRRSKLGEDLKKPIPSNLYHEIENKKKESCQYMRVGIITEGRRMGQVMTVCIEESCKTHHGRYSSSSETLKWKADQKLANEKKKLEDLIRLRILDETLKQIPDDLSKEDLVFIANEFFRDLWFEYQKKILSRHDLKPIKEQYRSDTLKPMAKYIDTLQCSDIYRLLMEMALIRNLPKPYQQKNDPLLEIARRYKVDTKQIEQAIKQEIKEKEKAKTVREKKKLQSLAKWKKGKEPVKTKKAGGKSEKLESGICRVCGCTEENACKGGCHWVDEKKTLCSSCFEKKVPCIDCANDATNGEGDCFRENFYDDGKGNLLCDSKKPLLMSVRSKKVKTANA